MYIKCNFYFNNKINLEILRNIRKICYIDIKNHKEYIKFLKNLINDNKNIKHELKQYLYNYWFKKAPKSFNYSEFFEYIKKIIK